MKVVTGNAGGWYYSSLLKFISPHNLLLISIESHSYVFILSLRGHFEVGLFCSAGNLQHWQLLEVD